MQQLMDSVGVGRGGRRAGGPGYSFCVLPGQLLAFFNVFLNKEFNKHLGGPRTTTRTAQTKLVHNNVDGDDDNVKWPRHMAQKTKKKKLKNNKMKQDCRARSNFWLCLSANSGQLSRFPIKILQTINKYK